MLLKVVRALKKGRAVTPLQTMVISYRMELIDMTNISRDFHVLHFIKRTMRKARNISHIACGCHAITSLLLAQNVFSFSKSDIQYSKVT